MKFATHGHRSGNNRYTNNSNECDEDGYENSRQPQQQASASKKTDPPSNSYEPHSANEAAITTSETVHSGTRKNESIGQRAPSRQTQQQSNGVKQ